jgi:hypothetical protein
VIKFEIRFTILLIIKICFYREIQILTNKIMEERERERERERARERAREEEHI